MTTWLNNAAKIFIFYKVSSVHNSFLKFQFDTDIEGYFGEHLTVSNTFVSYYNILTFKSLQCSQTLFFSALPLDGILRRLHPCLILSLEVMILDAHCELLQVTT